jgi:hypothetical protein
MADTDFFGEANPFLGFAEQEQPELAGRALFYSFGDEFGRGPSQQRSFQNQFSGYYNQYLGQLGKELRGGAEPGETTRFSDYISENPISRTIAGLPPSLTGENVGRFAPRTRFLTGF